MEKDPGHGDTSHFEKNEAAVLQDPSTFASHEGRRKSVALNIVENPLRVRPAIAHPYMLSCPTSD